MRALGLFACLAALALSTAGCGNCNTAFAPQTGGETCSFRVTFQRPTAACEKVDVFLLFDDTGSFAGTAPTVQDIFSDLVTDLQAAFPTIDFAFGVGRFEDFGGAGTGFSGENTTGRPFTLNQPILATTFASFSTLLEDALDNTAPGFGGDGPETLIEGLFQVATGSGFDGDGNSSSLDSGAAGSLMAQQTPGTSGDVPPFSSNVLPTSGTLGGVGWRTDSCRIVIVATDVCSVAPFAGAAPASITGTGGSVGIEEIVCDTTPGSDRFGPVSDAKSSGANTVTGAIAPAGAATIQATVTALNALGIRVIGLTNEASIPEGGSPTDPVDPPSSLPDFSGIATMQALAKLTGARDSLGRPLVFPITGSDSAALLSAITTAISSAILAPVTVRPEITGVASTTGGATSPITSVPPQRAGILPGQSASFTVTTPAGITGTLVIRDVGSGAILAQAGFRYQAGTCIPELIDPPTGLSVGPAGSPAP
ncbi:MAG: hypothetical protein ACT4PV_15785 [Planctomycetaceae bacterium]